MSQKPSIVILDDDPSHLHIHCLIIESAGFSALPVLVTQKEISLPESEDLHCVLLDYCLTVGVQACDVAQQIRLQYPSVPILLLSDLADAPADIMPYIQDFVRKGNPQQLLTTLRKLVHPAGQHPNA